MPPAGGGGGSPPSPPLAPPLQLNCINKTNVKEVNEYQRHKTNINCNCVHLTLYFGIRRKFLTRSYGIDIILKRVPEGYPLL